MAECRPISGLEGFIAEVSRERVLGQGPFRLEAVPADGSLRRFFRVFDAGGRPLAVAMENPAADDAAVRENRAYLMIGRHLKGKGAPLPEIYGADLESGRFLMEDLGEENLQGAVVRGEDPIRLYRVVLEALLHLQLDCVKGFDPDWCCQTRTYDRDVMRRNESQYFAAAFLKGYAGMDEDLSFLMPCFDYLAERASEAGCAFFMHRDFQSRNIAVKEGKIGILDWQGGRLGPLGYDLASLLIDPYTALREETRKRLYDYYRSRLEQRSQALASELDRTYPYLALQRNLQILGAFGFLTRIRKRTHFEAYIPKALSSLKALLRELGDGPFDPLRALVEERLSKGAGTP